MRRAALTAAALLLSAGAAAAQVEDDAPVRIVTFGTSLTAGEDWQSELERQLAPCHAVDITTIAKGGMNSEWGVDNVHRVAEAEPDVVLIEFSMNDADVIDGVGRARARDNTELIIEAIAAAGAAPILMTMNPAHGWVQQLRRLWLGDYYEDYRAIAQERGIGLIDLAPIWAAQPDLDAALPDGVHPRPETARAVIPAAVAEALEPLICPN